MVFAENTSFGARKHKSASRRFGKNRVWTRVLIKSLSSKGVPSEIYELVPGTYLDGSESQNLSSKPPKSVYLGTENDRFAKGKLIFGDHETPKFSQGLRPWTR